MKFLRWTQVFHGVSSSACNGVALRNFDPSSVGRGLCFAQFCHTFGHENLEFLSREEVAVLIRSCSPKPNTSSGSSTMSF